MSPSRARAHYVLCLLINLHIAEQFDVKKPIR